MGLLEFQCLVSNHHIQLPVQHVSSSSDQPASHHSALGQPQCPASSRKKENSHFLQRKLSCLIERARDGLAEVHLEFCVHDPRT